LEELAALTRQDFERKIRKTGCPAALPPDNLFF